LVTETDPVKPALQSLVEYATLQLPPGGVSPAEVVTASAVERADRLPAASRAATVNS
jgi:hypothetical protein